MSNRTRVCPAPDCQHHKEPQHISKFPAYQGAGKYICRDCRETAALDGTLGRICLQCQQLYQHLRSTQRRGLCEACERHLNFTAGRCWLVTNAPTSEGAAWKGRYLVDASMRDALNDAVFEPGTIVESWQGWVYKGAYTVVGAQTLLPDVLIESQKLIVTLNHRIRGDGRIFRR